MIDAANWLPLADALQALDVCNYAINYTSHLGRMACCEFEVPVVKSIRGRLDGGWIDVVSDTGAGGWQEDN